MNPQSTVQLPGQWSTFAAQVDWVYYFVYWVSVVLFVGVVGTALFFVWKYRRRPGVKAEPTGHNLVMEIGWTVSPLLLLALLFHWGFQGYVRMTVPPANALDIRVRARKWSWDFEYPNGGHTVNRLVVPARRPVRLVMSSEDVLHAMFIPAFRVKRDTVPGMYTTLWFEAVAPGRQHFFCAEYCGAADAPSVEADGRQVFTGHFSMNGPVDILDSAHWSTFLDEILRPPTVDGHEATPEQWGALLYTQNQCNTCHSVNGSAMTGPTWQRLFGSQVPLQDGTTVEADENYIRRSILQPAAQVHRGFNPVMPSFQGSLNDRQVDALIAYIRSLR